MNSALIACLNRDLVQGLARQCRARVVRLWACLRHDTLLEARLAAEYLRGSIQARYGHDRALAEWRLRRIERI